MNIYKTDNLYTSSQLQRELEKLEDSFVIIDHSSIGEKISIMDYNALTNGVNFSHNKNSSYHQWLIYREGFSHQLVETLIKSSTCSEDEIVLDPFCGSGTTNVVASQLGYSTIGIDVNPMSALLTEAKITPYDKRDIQEVWALYEDLLSFQTPPVPLEFNPLERYFKKENLEQLVRIKDFIDSLQPSGAKKILKVAFVSIILDCSDRKRDGNGLKKKETKVTDTISYYKEKLEQITGDILRHQADPAKTHKSINGTATQLSELLNAENLEENIGVIVFSPPYPNSFDYFESYKLELILGGFVTSSKSIKDFRKQAIRSFIGSENDKSSIWLVDELASEIQSRIPAKEKETGKTDNRTRKVPGMIKNYFNDMFKVLSECYTVLEAGKQVYIVVSQSAYLGVIVPTDLLFSAYAQEIGFSVKEIINCRNARTSTQQLNKYPYLKQGLRESIIVLEKK